ncbi:SCO family protein [Oceanospirillum sediminis]|uniref:SCO family protein n=1 Tax=Oceanospirillum sediminis TaxID=2760088 RepID=A0A839IZ26_9GAMM|nr:SCO family protein [Oceanospirillum sediminis]MBB1489617.1 SCO family protein [Oceanospirillum sediminis]
MTPGIQSSLFIVFSIIVISLSASLGSLNGIKVQADIPAFNGVTGRNKVVDESFLKNKKALIYFGYTACGGICYPRVQLFKKIKQDFNENISFIFITIDPDNDTTERMYNYFDYAGDDFHSLIIKDKSFFDAIRRQLANGPDLKKDPVNHSDFVYFSDNGKLKSIYAGSLIDSNKIIEDINLLKDI